MPRRSSLLSTGFILLETLEPLDWYDGLILLVFGLTAGHWSEQLSPTPRRDPEGPLLPWDDMRSEERFSYFLPALTLVVVGLIMFALTFQLSRVAFAWDLLAVSCFALALGCFATWQKWRHRVD
jgi:hypothetical protein